MPVEKKEIRSGPNFPNASRLAFVGRRVLQCLSYPVAGEHFFSGAAYCNPFPTPPRIVLESKSKCFVPMSGMRSQPLLELF